MGKDPAVRFAFIMDNAHRADELRCVASASGRRGGLMGKDPAVRFAFIMDSAHRADELDV